MNVLFGTQQTVCIHKGGLNGLIVCRNGHKLFRVCVLKRDNSVNVHECSAICMGGWVSE